MESNRLETVDPSGPTTIRYPVAAPVIGDLESELVARAVASGWVSSIGPFIDEFETQFANTIGVSDAIAVANGTVALHVALHALGIGRGDEVILPDLTFVATAHAVLMTGATPVLVDVDPRTWCLSPELVARAITKRTKAVIAVHLYGHPADMRALSDLCRPRGVALIEDAAEGLGASIDGVQAGALGDVGTFSFYGNKTITTGEGGMVTTNNRTLATKIRFLKDHGMSPKRRYYHSELAFNYRMTNIQAALGVAQLTQLGRFLSRKEKISRGYASGIRAVDVELNPVTPGVHNSLWMSSLLLGRSWSSARDDIAMMLELRGVDTRPFFEPMSSLPHLARYRCVGPDGGECSVSKRLSARGLNLPSSCALTDADVAMIASIVSEVLNDVRERRTCQSQLHLTKFVGDTSVSV